MARRGGFRVVTTEPDGREYVFNTVASTAAEAERTFRKVHPRWRRPIEVLAPDFPETKKGAK